MLICILVRGRCGAGAGQVRCRSGAAAMQVGCRYPYAPRLRPHAPRRQRSASRQPAAARVMCRALLRSLAALRVRPHGQTAMRPCYRTTYRLLPRSLARLHGERTAHRVVEVPRLGQRVRDGEAYAAPEEGDIEQVELEADRLLGLPRWGPCRARARCACPVRVRCVCAAGPQCGAVSHTPPASARTDS